MTQVDFHTHVDDKLGYACRLVRKVYQTKQSLVVLAEPSLLRTFDERLWTFAALEFVPHCMIGSAVADQTPIVLTDCDDDTPDYPVLLNLSPRVPPHFARFERLLEVVGSQADDLTTGRERFRFYREQGHVLNFYKQATTI